MPLFPLHVIARHTTPALTFTRAEVVEPGGLPTSCQQRSLARACNDRLRGPTDAAWRVAWATYNQARLVRNPESSVPVGVFPAEHEFWSYYVGAGRERIPWPDAPPGEFTGANLASVLPQFIFGNSGTPDEPGRLSELLPMRLPGGVIAVTPAEKWSLGKVQRGPALLGGHVIVPAFEAAQSVFPFAFAPLIFHGKSFGGWAPKAPDHPTIPWCGDVGTGYESWPNRQRYWTGLSADVSTSALHGVISTVGGKPRVTYEGSCPCGSPNHAAGHILGVGVYPFAWYVQISTGQEYDENNQPVCPFVIDYLPTADWIEGPYTDPPSLAHGQPDHILRAVGAYHSDFRGSDAQRTFDTWLAQETAFPSQDFFTRQYALAPAYGTPTVEGETVPYPRATALVDGTYPLLLGGSSWTPHAGYTVAGYAASASGLVGPVKVTIQDGPTVIATLLLNPDSGGVASALRWVGESQRTTLTAVVSGLTVGTVIVEAAEILAYKPQMWDAYLVVRMGTATGA